MMFGISKRFGLAAAVIRAEVKTRHDLSEDERRALATWLETHSVTRCPDGHALGMSALERDTGIVATTQTWVERAQHQIGSDVAAAKQKRLRSQKTSGI